MQATRSGTIEEKAALLERLIKAAPPAAVKEFNALFDMSWIYHDSALEGVVYTQNELTSALANVIPDDTSLVPTYDEIRQNKAALDFVRDLVDKSRLPIDLELIKKVYFVLAPDEAEPTKSKGLFRKDIPVHRVYFHDIAPPDKIALQLQNLIKEMKEEKKTKTHPIRLAARVHQTLLQISPFPKHSGKVARLVMNLILLRNGYPPAIIHATERQRYYESLRGTPSQVAALVQESLGSAVDSGIRYFEEYASRSSAGAYRAP